MAIYEFTNTVDGDEDPIFIEAATEDDARTVFAAQIGPMPANMLKVREIQSIPEGHDLL